MYHHFACIQAITDEGQNPDEYVFELVAEKKTPVKRASINSRTTKANGDDEDDETAVNSKKSRAEDDENDVGEEDEDAEANKTTEKVNNITNNNNGVETKKDIKNNDEKSCVVDAVGDVDDDHIQLTTADSDKLDTSNVDNEDSLNLTIGEDEAEIFQDDVGSDFI